MATIIEEIRHRGPIPFARFMDLALYHPTFGYYMRCADPADTTPQDPDCVGEGRIGWAGDYYTTSDVSPVLAQSVARQIDQMDRQLGSPDPLTVVEMGAGTGVLARDVLQACRAQSGSLWSRLRYRLVERSPAMRASQQRHLAPWIDESGRVAWMNDLSEFGPDGLTGVVFSNELVDAFPVHRIRVVDGDVREVFVDHVDDRFCERLHAGSTPDLDTYVARLARLGVVFPEGMCTEINLHAVAWMQAVARALRRGFVITIDYGHTAPDLYGPGRRNGTLLCYYHHTASEDPYQRVGLQDMTAHVDFSTLALVGNEAGLGLTGFTNQMSFLIGLGVEQALEGIEPGSAECQSIVELLRPEGMGRTFKVLIQHKAVEPSGLDGLRYRAFFNAALDVTRNVNPAVIG